MQIDIGKTAPCCDPGFPSREHRMHNFYAASRSGILLRRTMQDKTKREVRSLDKNGGKIIKWEYTNKTGHGGNSPTRGNPYPAKRGRAFPRNGMAGEIPYHPSISGLVLREGGITMAMIMAFTALVVGSFCIGYILGVKDADTHRRKASR